MVLNGKMIWDIKSSDPMIEVPSHKSCSRSTSRTSLLFKQQIVLDGRWTPTSKRILKTHSSRWLNEDTLTPKCTCMCICLALFELHEVVHIGSTCSILETFSGERTGKRIQM